MIQVVKHIEIDKIEVSENETHVPSAALARFHPQGACKRIRQDALLQQLT